MYHRVRTGLRTVSWLFAGEIGIATVPVCDVVRPGGST